MVGAAVLAVVAIVALGGAYSERKQEIREIRDLGDQLREARIVADSCRRALVQEEDDFRRFDARVDSLRGVVSDFEALDERGVPQEEYEEYLTIFDGYNESVDGWQALADTLRRHETECRTLVETHNLMSDSLQTRLGEEGVETGG